MYIVIEFVVGVGNIWGVVIVFVFIIFDNGCVVGVEIVGGNIKMWIVFDGWDICVVLLVIKVVGVCFYLVLGILFFWCGEGLNDFVNCIGVVEIVVIVMYDFNMVYKLWW